MDSAPESHSQLFAVIPVYNGAATLDAVLDGVVRHVPASGIVVVDDGSTDGSDLIALRRGVTVIRHGSNRGKGTALESAFQSLRGRQDVDFVITLDADLQHPPVSIPEFLGVQRGVNADLVIGWRRRSGSRMPLARMLSNALTSALLSARTGVRMKDSQCGFRLIRRSLLDRIALVSTGYEAETEFLIKAARLGSTIAFAPIETIYNGEKSSMTHWNTTVKFVEVLLKEY